MLKPIQPSTIHQNMNYSNKSVTTRTMTTNDNALPESRKSIKFGFSQNTPCYPKNPREKMKSSHGENEEHNKQQQNSVAH